MNGMPANQTKCKLVCFSVISLYIFRSVFTPARFVECEYKPVNGVFVTMRMVAGVLISRLCNQNALNFTCRHMFPLLGLNSLLSVWVVYFLLFFFFSIFWFCFLFFVFFLFCCLIISLNHHCITMRLARVATLICAI